MNKFLKTATILLVSAKPTHRSGVRKILCDLGADNHNIEVAAEFGLARDRLLKEPISILIADDDLSEKEQGIDLLPLHEANNPISRSRLFVLMAGEVSPFLESDFALRGGDLIIKKPFTNASFTEFFKDCVMRRESLPLAERVSMDVQDALKMKDVEGALKFFESFPDQTSAEALFCKACIYESDEDHVRSFKNFARSVEKDPNIKSVVSAIRSGSILRKFDQMEDIVETWINKFPIYDKAVPDITRVLIYNMRFELLNKLVKDLADKTSLGYFVKAPLAAGLVVSAIAWLEKGNSKKAITAAERGIRLAWITRPDYFKRSAGFKTSRRHRSRKGPSGRTSQKSGHHGATKNSQIKLKTSLYNQVIHEISYSFSRTHFRLCHCPNRSFELKKNGVTMEGIVAFDDKVEGPRPGVVVFPDWMGRGKFSERKARELAELGYVALAADIYGKGQKAKDSKEAGELAGRFKSDRKTHAGKSSGGLEALARDRRVNPKMLAATGYCFGGTAALELAREGAPIRGAVSFHGGLESPLDIHDMHARILVLHGADDPFVKPSEVAEFQKEMTDIKADWQMVYYSNAVHAFTNPDAGKDNSTGAAYNRLADERSWVAMKNFLAEIFHK